MATNPGAVGRGGRVILSLAEKITQPQQCSVQADEHNLSTTLLTALQRLEADLWVETRAFQHRQRRRGLFGSERLRKCDADRVLKQELAKLAEVVS